MSIGPAHDRLAVLHSAVREAHERTVAVREREGLHPLDLLSPRSAERRAAEDALRAAFAAVSVEVKAGQAERDAEWLANVEREERARRA